MNQEYLLKTLTPIFSYGANQKQPEIRAPSIRGQLRWWMDKIGHADQVDRIFGSTAGGDARASKVIVRVGNVSGNDEAKGKPLPHKNWKPNQCYKRGTSFSVMIIERLISAKSDFSREREILHKTLQAWIHLGTLGGRGTRGAGSIWPQDQYPTEAEWAQLVSDCSQGSSLKIRLSKEAYKYEEDARKDICNTLGETCFPNKQLGGIEPRKTSPLRLRVVRFADCDRDRPFRICAVWTERNEHDLDKAAGILASRGKQLGKILQNAIRIN